MLKHYLTVAFRNLWKYRVQNFLGITGLSLGFLCFSIVVFNIEWNTGRDTEYPGAKRIYILMNEHYSDYNGSIYNLNQALPEIEKITLCKKPDYQASFFLLDTVKSQYYNFGLIECDTAFIDFFSLKILAGNKYAINNTVNSVILFDTKATEIDKNIHSVIGKTIQNGDERFQIAGIVQRPVNSDIMLQDGFIVNKEGSVLRNEIYNKWNLSYQTYIMLKNNVSEKKFKETLSNRRFDFTLHKERLGMRITEDGSYIPATANEEDERFTVKPLNNPLEYVSITHYLEQFLVGLLILLTTLFNYTSFQTSQFYNRLRECALRRTAGAGKKDLFFLFFSEIIIAFVIVYFVSLLFLHLFKGYIPEVGFYLPDINIIQVKMLKYLLFVLLIASVLYLIPINIIHRMSIRTVFLGISQKGKKGTVRNMMLFFQLVVLLLFISAFTIVGLQRYKCKTLLFNHLPEEDRMNIVYSSCYHEELTANKDAVIGEITSSPFVDRVLINEDLASSSGSYIQYNDGLGIPGLEDKMIGHRNVHPDFFDFFKCKLLAGEFFTKDSSPDDVVIDENFAYYYKDRSPVGESFAKYRIAGVIKNLNTYKDKGTFRSKKFPVFYTIDNTNRSFFVLYVKSQKGKTEEVQQLMENTFKKFLPEDKHHQVFTRSFEKELESQLYRENRLLRPMGTLFVLSLVICLLGIYSAIVMNTEKRRKEIAIRKINGATMKDIIILFGKTYVVLWTSACILFFPVVYYFGNRWLEKYTERISLNTGLFAGIYLVIMTLVVLTIIFQILKVARCNPAEVIKKE